MLCHISRRMAWVLQPLLAPQPPALFPQVFSQQALATYEAALQAWEAERARQATEFTITERDLEAQGGPEPPAPVRTHLCDQSVSSGSGRAAAPSWPAP